MALEHLGLRLGELGLFDEHYPAIFGFGGEGMLEGEDAHLLGQADRMAAYHWTERAAATAKKIGALGAVACAATALLLIHFLAGAPNLGAPLNLMGAGAALGELPDDAALDEIMAWL